MQTTCNGKCLIVVLSDHSKKSDATDAGDIADSDVRKGVTETAEILWKFAKPRIENLASWNFYPWKLSVEGFTLFNVCMYVDPIISLR